MDNLKWHRLFAMELADAALLVAESAGDDDTDTIDVYLTASIAQSIERDCIADALCIDCYMAYGMLAQSWSDN